MRIVGGQFRGRALVAPEGRGTRPTSDRAREALFNILAHATWAPDLDGARVIDLFAGSGALGFYAADEAARRTPILSVRVASDLPVAEQPKFEYLSTESQTFATYAEAIANRRDPFFIVPAGGADICNIRVPVRRVAAAG